MGFLTDKTIEGLFFGPLQNGKRKGLYREYRLKDTEWNTDLESLSDGKGNLRRKLYDGDGLYLYLSDRGNLLWRFDYSYLGKRKTASFGVYPDVGIKAARDLLQEARTLLAQGKDPMQEKKDREIKARLEAEHTFKAVAKDWHHAKMEGLKRADEAWRFLEVNVFPDIGNTAIARVTRADVLAIVRRVEDRGSLSVARRILSFIERILTFAVNTGVLEGNCVAGLRDVLQRRQSKHRAKIEDPAEMGRFLRDMDSPQAQETFMPITRLYLKILPHVFVRAKELAGAEWSEIDFDTALWTIPAERMKSRRQHVVPLSRQVLALFWELEAFTGAYSHCFESKKTPYGYINSPSLLTRLRGFEGTADYRKDSFTLHGFRGTASTWLHEMGYRTEWIEAQLAHVDPNTTRAAYNSAQYLEDRRAMMQSWSDYLDKLKEEKKC